MGALRDSGTFRLLWSANLVASLANWSAGIAVAVRIFTLTGSPAATAGLLVAATVPPIALGSVGGVVADRVRRDRLLRVVGALRVLAAAALPVAGDHPAGLYAVAAGQAVLLLFFTPAEQATVADVVPARDLPAALTANAVAGNATRLAGPALGGLLVTVTGFPAAAVTVVVAYALAAVLLGLLPPVPATARPVPGRRPPYLAAWLDGLQTTVTEPRARAVAVFQVLDAVKEGPLTALYPALMLGTIGTTAATMGAVNGSFAVTALAGAPLVGLVVRRLGHRVPIAGGAVVCGLLLLLLAGRPGTATALAAFALSGFPFTLAWVAASTWLLAGTAPSHRGRVTGTVATLNAAATAGFAAIAGVAAEVLPVTLVLAAAALVQIAAGPVFLLMTAPRGGCAPYAGQGDDEAARDG